MSETVVEAIARVISARTRAGNAALAGGALLKHGTDYALAMPSGEVYLISIKPARIVVNDAPSARPEQPAYPA